MPRVGGGPCGVICRFRAYHASSLRGRRPHLQRTDHLFDCPPLELASPRPGFSRVATPPHATLTLPAGSATPPPTDLPRLLLPSVGAGLAEAGLLPRRDPTPRHACPPCGVGDPTSNGPTTSSAALRWSWPRRGRASPASRPHPTPRLPSLRGRRPHLQRTSSPSWEPRTLSFRQGPSSTLPSTPKKPKGRSLRTGLLG